VRLYETRDGTWTGDGKYIPGKTTLSEVQLIGRGARYFPFTVNGEDNRFKRKFDNDPENEMKILEELYYHSSYVPKYIAELKAALRESGITPPQEPKTITLKVKEDFKATEFWKKGFILINSKEKTNGLKLEDATEIVQSKVYGPIKLKTGNVREEAVFENGTAEYQTKTESINLKGFNAAVIRKAIAKNDFFRFNNLKEYFPKLDSVNSFIECIKKANVDVTSSENKLRHLTPDDKLEICTAVLKQLESHVKSRYTEYKGTTLFMPRRINEIVKDKTLNININSDREAGRPMKDPANTALKLDDRIPISLLGTNFSCSIIRTSGGREGSNFSKALSGISPDSTPRTVSTGIFNARAMYSSSSNSAISRILSPMLLAKPATPVSSYSLLILFHT